MRLVRLTIVHISPKVDHVRALEIGRKDQAFARVLSSWDAPSSSALVLTASVHLQRRPSVDEAGLIRVPDRQRRQLEDVLERMADVTAILSRRRRAISSPSPCVALETETRKDKEWLAQAQGFKITPSGFPSVSSDIDVDRHVIVDLLQDRADGVALLAEALAHSHATGKLVEFMRFFERAFAAQAEVLTKALATFLRGAKLGYTAKEVDVWWQELRNSAVHGKRPRVVFEADVRPFIARVEQAAFDVLFNKVEWGTTSRTRRAYLVPPVGLTGNGMYLKKGVDNILQFQLLDDFGVYPLDLAYPRIDMPSEWWSPHSPDRVQQMSGVLEIIE